jgi:flagellar operon protein
MKLINYGDVNRIQPKPIDLTNRNSVANPNKGFDSILQDAVVDRQQIKFSKHAQARMTQRNINLTQPEMEKIGEAVNRAGSKGIKDSLVLLDKVALIVNIPSRTIVTTVDEKSIKESVFTNIDGAVIL